MPLRCIPKTLIGLLMVSTYLFSPVNALATSFLLGPLEFLTPPKSNTYIVKWEIDNDPRYNLTFTSKYGANNMVPPSILRCDAGITGSRSCDHEHPLKSTPTPGEIISNKNFFTFITNDVKPGQHYFMLFTVDFALYSLKTGATAPWDENDYNKVTGTILVNGDPLTVDNKKGGSKTFTLDVDIATPSPEPSTWLLTGICFGGIMWWQCRKMKKHEA